MHPGVTSRIHTHANKESCTHLIPSRSCKCDNILHDVCGSLPQSGPTSPTGDVGVYGYGESINVAMNPVGRGVRADIDGRFFSSRCILAYLLSLPCDI